MLGAQGSGLQAQGSGVEDAGSRGARGSRFMRFRVQGSGFRIQSSGSGDEGRAGHDGVVGGSAGTQWVVPIF